jgi:hypothetical protein
VELQVENRAAAGGERVVGADVRRIEPIQYLRDFLVPRLARRREGLARDGVLEALVGGEHQQVPELEPGAEHPEAGIGHAENPDRGKADPVGRDEHADRAGVEGRGQVVEESRLGGHGAVIITRLRGEWRRGSTNDAGVRQAAAGGRRVT